MFASLTALPRFVRLALMALVALTPAVVVEVRRDVIEVVEGGPAPDVKPEATPVVASLERRDVSWAPSAQPPRVVPRTARVSRFLLHRALLI